VREAEAAGNSSDVHVDEQLRRKSTGGDSLPSLLILTFPLTGERLHG